MWSPLIEEHGNKTLTWNRQDSGAPRPRKTQEETSLGRFFFSRLLPLHNVELEEPKFKDSGEKEKKKAATWRNKGTAMQGFASVTLKQTLSGEKKKKCCRAANFLLRDEARSKKVLKPAIFHIPKWRNGSSCIRTSCKQKQSLPEITDGGEKSPQDKNRELQTRLDFVRLLSEWRNLLRRVDTAAPAEMLAELSSRAAWTLWCQEKCACCVFCSKLLESLGEVSNLRQLYA